MASNSEQIEAKLCAYLEGEIDAKDRAEIERHLEKNPGHRKLLDELARTRTLLSGLPRVKAPMDVAEQLQGQLERSVLLDGMDESDTGALRIGPRWPQYLAYAAVGLLAVGLVAVVYFVVQPEGGQPGGPVAVNLPVSETDSVARMSELPSDTAAPGTTDSALSAVAPSETAVASALPPMPSVPGAMTPSLMDEMQPSAIFDTHPPGRETMFVVVEADDPSYANKQVASYMLLNNISWQNIAEPMSDAEAETTTGSRMQYQRVGPTLRADGTPTDADAQAEASRPRDNAGGGAAGFGVPPAAATAGPTTRGYGGVPPAEVAVSEPAPAPALDASREARAKEAEIARPRNEAIADNAIVVARNIPRSQALEMRDSLHQQSGEGSRIYSQFIPADTLEKQFAFKDGSVYLSPTEPVGRIAQIYPEVFDSLMKGDTPAPPTSADTPDDAIPLVMQQAIDSFVLRNNTEMPIPQLLESSQRVTDGARMVSLDKFSAPTSPPEDRMDVVIVVQPKSTAEPATRPVTPARTP